MESQIFGGKKILVSRELEMGIFAVKKCAYRSGNEMKFIVCGSSNSDLNKTVLICGRWKTGPP